MRLRVHLKRVHLERGKGGERGREGGERKEIKGIIFKDISNLSPLLGTDSAWPGGEGLRVPARRCKHNSGCVFLLGFVVLVFFFVFPYRTIN